MINGVITQVQIMSMIGFITLNAMKKRFLVAYLLNVSFFVLSLYTVTFLHVYGAVPGLAISLSLLLIILLLQKYNARQVSTFKDLEQKTEQLQQMVYFDILTGLPNRKMIIDRINFLIHKTGETSTSFAIVFVDLDNFKKTNDVYGHSVGDRFLIEISSFMRSCINEHDMLGRLGGDEFVLIVQRKLKSGELYQYVDNLRNCLSGAISLSDFEIFPSASFGISTYPEDGHDAEELLKFADTAMYSAKEAGKNNVQFFNKDLYEGLMQRFVYEQHLKTAISNGEMFLNFQPQFTAADQKLRGFEVLLRWNSPQHGLVSPVKFIPVAEETGMIIAIGEWVLRESCKKIMEINRLPDGGDIVMSINLSVVQVMDVNFLAMLEHVLAETKVNPGNLEFEVTESIFITSFDYVTDILNKVKRLGIRIALDDFGTGYSSLNYLQVLPIDTLKIDKSFIDRISGNDPRGKIVGSLIALIHQLGLSVVAEGVENDIQKEYLVENTCDYIQGFLWGKPLNEKETNALLNDLFFPQAEVRCLKENDLS
jgi:diguanylate cyclase (GGDEF)-like protein